MEKIVKILNETGLHARPASLLVKAATPFSSEITIEFKDNVFIAKSIMSILSAGLQKGDEIKIVAKGSDEKEAVEALADLINSKFGE
ncbi:phosphocarrier protein [Anaerosolibacter carboniphilus]|uniref:Phosphocarrier protein HPr n=1 Tax=Anaerosolibacter carboniphilus TaxID=1417629 RepID=A0A841L653_9FIRM|nr:HPr family phosphocarrier protein [Anaerosolibacter carboniphilus]MBB6217869.1 phosphocarrier protein [Anaerosolibacter carboniphilus]